MRPAARSLLARLARIAVVALAVLVVAALATAWWGTHRLQREQRLFSAQIGPLETAAYKLEAPPDTDNAAYWLALGAAQVALDDGERAALSRWLRSRTSNRTLEAPPQSVVESVARNDQAIETMERAAGCADSSFGIDLSKGLEAALPDFSSLLTAVRLLDAEAALAIPAADTHRLERALATLERAARALLDEPVLISYLVGLAAERQYLWAVRDAVAAAALDENSTALARANVGALDLRARLLRAIGAEAAVMSVHETREAMRGTAGAVPTRLEMLLAGFAEKHLKAGLLRDYRRLAAHAKEHRESDPAPAADSVLGGMLVPNLLDVIAKTAELETALELAKVALEVTSQARATGRYPAALPDRGDLSGVEGGAWVLRADGSARLAAREDSTPAGEPSPDRSRALPPLAWELPAP